MTALCTTHSEKSTMFLQNSWFNYMNNYKLASGMELLKQAAAKQGEPLGETVAADLMGRCLEYNNRKCVFCCF